MYKIFADRFGVMGLLAAVISVLAGCSPTTQMSEEEVTERHKLRPDYEVELTTHRHLVPVDPGRVAFAEQQRRDLYDFLVGVGAQPGDRVIVAARRSRLDHRGDIVKFTRELGLNPDLRLIKDMKLGAEDDGYDRAILIQFERYTTRNPDCGRWQANDVVGRYNNVNPVNFGCASMKAMQQQIAYPSSLVAGDTLAFPEASKAAKPVGGYLGRTGPAPKAE